MAITYHAGRRIQGLSTDVLETPTMTDDMSSDNYTHLNGNTSVSGSKLLYAQSSADNRAYRSITQVASTFYIEWETVLGTASTGHRYHNLVLSEENTNVKTTSSNDGYAIVIDGKSGSVSNVYIQEIYSGTVNQSSASNGSIIEDLSQSAIHYFTFSRSGNVLTVESFSDSARTVSEGSGSLTLASTSTGFVFLQHGTENPSTTVTGVTIDNIKYYNGVSSLSSKPTDVQVGSRYEETDTRKMYHYEEQVPDYDYPMTTDPRTNTFNSSICTITHANSTLQMNQLTATGTSGSATYIDLGSNLSTKWVMRFKTKQTGYTNYQYNSQFQVGMSSVAPTSTAYNISSSLNWIGFRWYFGTQFSSPYVGIEPRIGQNTGDNSHSNTNARLYGKPNHVSDTTTPYYHEFIWNVDTFTYNLYTNENYTGTATATATMSSSTNTQWVTGTPSSISGLRYLVFKQGGDSNMGVWVNQLDDVEIWDGVTVAATGNAWKEEGT